MSFNLPDTRKYLHQNPELSEQEKNTALFIEQKMAEFKPDQVIKIGYSRVFVFDSKKPGKTIAFRADMDALPILETGKRQHSSTNKGIAHACGHDGHMTVLLGLAEIIAKCPPQKAKVVLVFQSAEETGQGAKRLTEDEAFQKLRIDYIFGWHNIPSVDLGKMLIRKEEFASASCGLIVNLLGKTSHAAEPENGINPALAIAEITQKLHELVQQKEGFKSLILLTFIYTKMGEIAFGTSAGDAELGFTLRAFDQNDMEKLKTKSEEVINEIAHKNQLKVSFKYTEEFPVTKTTETAYEKIKSVAKKLNLSTDELNEPMKWSEDFGYYYPHIQTGFYGLGSGLQQARLHHPDYDFPDELLQTGVAVFRELYFDFQDINPLKDN